MPAADDSATGPNRAAEPTRAYASDRDTHIDLVLLLKNRSAEQKAVLRELLAHGELNATPEQRHAAAWINKWAESFGFVPMIEDHQARLRFTPAAPDPVRHALDDPQAQPRPDHAPATRPDPTGQGVDPRRGLE